MCRQLKKIITNNTFWTAIASIVVTIALLVSMGIFNKADIAIYYNGIYLTPTTNSDRLMFIIPIAFENKGNKGTVIESIVLNLNHKNYSTNYYPAYELDSYKFLQMRCLHSNNILNSFLPFGLEAHNEKTKLILFIPQDNILIDEGEYNITLIINNDTAKYYPITITIFPDQILEYSTEKNTFYFDIAAKKYDMFRPSLECKNY